MSPIRPLQPKAPLWTPLLLGAGAIFLVLAFCLLDGWSDAQVPTQVGSVPQERGYEAPATSTGPSASGVRWDAGVSRAETPDGPAAPLSPQYLKFGDLHRSVQNFLKQAGKAHRDMNVAELECLEFEPKLVGPYTEQVERLVREFDTATAIYDLEVERAAEAATRSGRFTDYPDEATFRKAVEAANLSAGDPFVIVREGEMEGPSGEPRRIFQIASLNLQEHPALQQAKRQKDGLEPWREVLRANALGLIATARRTQGRQ